MASGNAPRASHIHRWRHKVLKSIKEVACPGIRTRDSWVTHRDGNPWPTLASVNQQILNVNTGMRIRNYHYFLYFFY